MPVVKGATIIAYLLFAEKPTVSRRFLAGLLWSESTEAASLSALRQCLYQLKVWQQSCALDFLTISNQSVSIDRSKVSTDVWDLEAGLTPSHGSLESISADRLLYGYEDVDPGFTDWLWEFRRVTGREVCQSLTSRLNEATDDKDRLAIARTLNRLDPALEIAARPIIDEHIKNGNVVELLRVYSQLCDALEDEWSEEPSDELQRVVGEARSRLGDHLPASSSNDQTVAQPKYLCVLAAKIHPVSADVAGITMARDAFVKAVRPILMAHSDAVIASTDGDISAVFGLPNAHETMVRDCISMAVTLEKTFRETVSPLLDDPEGVRLVIGADSGLLSVLESSDAQTPLISGPALARVSNLFQQVDGAGVFVPDTTIRNLEHLFDIEATDIQMDGLPLVKVLGCANDVRMPIDPHARVFVGRSGILASMQAVWEEASFGKFQIVSLQGPAGIGKTSVVEQFFSRLRADSVRVTKIICSRFDRSAPLEPVKQLLAHLDTEKKSMVPNDATTAHKLARLLAQEPTAIFIDDWQWADIATRKALQDVATLAGYAPILLVIASRELSFGDGVVQSSQHIHMPPMNAREVGRAAEHMLQAPIDRTLRDALYSKSGGNPLYLEEICHALLRSQVGEAFAPGLDLLAANLNALIMSRIEELSDDDAAVVFAAAPHSEIIDAPLLGDVMGKKVSDTTLKRLCALGVLCQNGTIDGGLRFKHGITRDVVYSMIPEQRRSQYHAAYFKALKAKPDHERATNALELLALHARNSGDIDAAADCAEMAGDAALAASSLDQAKRQYEVVLSMLDEMDPSDALTERWLSVAKRWALPCVYAASADHIPVLQRAAETAEVLGDQKSLAELLYWMGYIHLVLGDYDQSITDMVSSHALAEGIEHKRLLAESTAIHGCALAAKTLYAEAEPKLLSAIEIKDQNPVKQGRAPVTSVYSRAMLAVIRADQGKFGEAEQLVETALLRVEGFRHEIESSICNLGAAVRIWRGEWAEARDLAARSCERSESVAAPFLIGNARCLHSYASWKLTKNPNFLETLETTARWLDAQGMRLYLTFFYGWLADALFEIGRLEDAAAAARRTLQQTPMGEAAGAPLACRVLARVAVSGTDQGLQDALSHLEDARRWSRFRGSDHELAKCALLEAELYAQAGRNADAAQPLEFALGIFNALGMDWHTQRSEDLRRTMAAGTPEKIFI